MATTTKLTASNGFYGNSGRNSYTNSAATHMYVGKYGSYTYRSRMTFPALGSVANIGDSRIVITKAVLHIRQNDGGKAEVTAGASGSSGWSAAYAASASEEITSTSAGWRTIDVTACASAIAGFAGNWYMHLRSAGYIRFNGTGSAYKPYLMVTWEYVAATITGDSDDVTLGEKVTFTIAPEVSGETHTLQYSIGDTSGTIAERAGDSIEWTPPVSLATEITDDDTGMVEIMMTAYDASGNVLRTERYYQTVTVPDSVMPVVSSIGASLKSGLSGYGLTGRSYAVIAPEIDMNGAQGAVITSVEAQITNGNTVQTLKWTAMTESGAGVFTGAAKETIAFASAGTATLTLTVTDSRGRTAQATQTWTVCAYAQPVITEFSVERYEPVYDANEEISGYQASDLGGYVWVNLAAAVQAVAPAGTQLNALKWTVTAVNAGTGATLTKSGTGAQAVNIVQDRTVFPDAVDGAATWNYTLTVTDTAGGRAVQYSSVLPGRANFALAKSKYGAAFGGIPKGTQENPMLESHYPVHGYAGFFGPDGNRMDRVFRSEALTIANADFCAYGDNHEESAGQFIPTVSRVGPLVFLDGLMSNRSAVTLDTDGVAVATLPEWARPKTDVFVLHQGSTYFIWWLRIAADGTVTFSRYRTGSSYESLTAGRQFPLTAGWIAADAFD